MTKTLYKVLLNNQSCHGGTFDWSGYLPTQNDDVTCTPGKWTPEQPVNLCSSGYHVTEHWNMWWKEGCDIFECEAKGLHESCDVGVNDKYVAVSIRLLRKVEFTFDSKNNTGNRNTGNRNTGDWNVSSRNTGSFNTKTHPVMLFDKPISQADYNAITWPYWFYFAIVDGDMKKSWAKALADADAADVVAATNLPNFDYDVFETVTGITKSMIDDKTKETDNGK